MMFCYRNFLLLSWSGDQRLFICNFTADNAQNSAKQSSGGNNNMPSKTSHSNTLKNSLFITLNYAVWFTPAHGNIHTLMAFCCVNVCHLAWRNAIRYICEGTVREKCEPHVVNNSLPVTVCIQFTISDVLFWNSIAFTSLRQVAN